MSVVIPYKYITGSILDPDGHNQNIYTDTPHTGIMSTANGQLHSTNFDSSFQVQSEHIHPEEVLRGRQDSGLETLDYFSDGIADSDQATFVNVAGCGVKVYVPYSATLALWQWSFFFSNLKSVTLDQHDEYVSGDIVVRAALNGTALQHTMRGLPETSTHGVYAGYNNSNETMACQYWDMSHLQTNLSAGWHDLNLTIYMQQVLDSDSAATHYQSATRKTGVFSGSTSIRHYIYNRASFGVRNARVLTIL